MAKAPNFLLFINDQHRADHVGCYGNGVVRTPHIDGLAARGTRYDRFYVTTPICMPNRASLMTGRMPSLHGSRHNGIPLSLGATTFVDLLAAAGYRTALIGKCHLQSMSPRKPTLGMPEVDPAKVLPPHELKEADKLAPSHGRYDQELRNNWQGNPDFAMDLPYYGFQHVDLCVGHGDQVWGHYGRWLEGKHPGSDALRGPGNQLAGNSYVAPQACRTAIPEELYPTAFVADKTCEYLTRHASEAKDDPFFIQCSFPDPHHPFTPPGKYWDMYSPDEIALPPSFHSNRPPPPQVSELYRVREAGKANREGQRVIAVTETEAREAIALTYGMITMIDDRIGQILAKLAELGLADDTVVIFTTDHGDFMGDHQLLLKGALHYQGLIRVPFIWTDPAAPADGAVSSDLCGTLDIARTVLDRAGVGPFNGMQGRSLTGPGDPDQPVMIEEHQRYGYMGFDHGFRIRTLVTRRHRFTMYQDMDWGELYDLEADPGEQVNLWGDPGHRALRDDMTATLAKRMMALMETSPLATNHGP